MISRPLWINIGIGVAGVILFQWTVPRNFQPLEVSLDLGRLESQKMLSGSWKIIPSVAFRGIMDVYVQETPASISFELPAADTYWLRVKARFLHSQQPFQMTLNETRTISVESSRIRRAEKFAWRIPEQYFMKGVNRLTFQSARAPMLVEEVDLKNYRSRMKELPIYVGFDQSLFAQAGTPLRWETAWLILFAIGIVAGLDRLSIAFWSRLHPHRSWTLWLTRASLIAPLAIFLCMMFISGLTPYRLIMKTPAFALVCLGGFGLVQLLGGMWVAPLWAWRHILELPIVQNTLALAVRPEQIPLRLKAKIRVLLRLSVLLVRESPVAISRVWHWLMQNPIRWHRAFIGCMVCAGLLLMLQGMLYLTLIKVPGQVVDAHGAYPFLRWMAELLGDAGILALLGLIASLLWTGNPHPHFPNED